MPLKKCTTDNKSGYKWGNEGKCYTGPNAKKEAIKQGLAIEGPEKFSQKAFEVISDHDERDEVESHIYLNKQDIKTVTDWMYNEGYDYGNIVATAFALIASTGRSPTVADQIAGYPPNCNEGYVEKDGKCVPVNETD